MHHLFSILLAMKYSNNYFYKIFSECSLYCTEDDKIIVENVTKKFTFSSKIERKIKYKKTSV